MELGDKIEKLTEAVGVKPCEGCKQRKDVLNAVSRRGLLKGIATGVIAYGLGAKTLKAQSAVANDRKAIDVLRFINTAQDWHKQRYGRYLPLNELLQSPVVQEIKAKKWATLIESLKDDPEIIPGWQLEHNINGNGETYNVTIKTIESTTFKFSTDHNAIIDLGHPLAVKGWVAGMFFRCIGPIGLPGCCCQYECCDMCNCGPAAYCRGCGCCFNCGCSCCVWCESNC